MEYDFSGWREIYLDEDGQTMVRDPNPGTYLGVFDPNFHVELKKAIMEGRLQAKRVKSLQDIPKTY